MQEGIMPQHLRAFTYDMQKDLYMYINVIDIYVLGKSDRHLRVCKCDRFLCVCKCDRFLFVCKCDRFLYANVNMYILYACVNVYIFVYGSMCI